MNILKERRFRERVERVESNLIYSDTSGAEIYDIKIRINLLS